MGIIDGAAVFALQQRPCVALTHPPGIGEIESAISGLRIGIDGGACAANAGGTTAYPVSGVSSTRAVDIPIAVADRAGVVVPHQPADGGRAAHAACRVAVADRAKEGTARQPAAL